MSWNGNSITTMMLHIMGIQKLDIWISYDLMIRSLLIIHLSTCFMIIWLIYSG